ncbi:MAG: hypothetical protein ACI9HK_005390, partial [Pirellulaceae bacterium]
GRAETLFRGAKGDYASPLTNLETTVSRGAKIWPITHPIFRSQFIDPGVLMG